MRVTLVVRPKRGILDPQGEAIRRSLEGLGYACRDVRAGKVFDLELDADGPDEARRLAREVADRMLANPLIEEYDVELPGDGA